MPFADPSDAAWAANHAEILNASQVRSQISPIIKTVPQEMRLKDSSLELSVPTFTHVMWAYEACCTGYLKKFWLDLKRDWRKSQRNLLKIMN